MDKEEIETVASDSEDTTRFAIGKSTDMMVVMESCLGEGLGSHSRGRGSRKK